MADLFFNLPPLVQMVLKGLAVILVIFPIAGASSLAERKVAAWIQDRPGPNRTMVIWAKYIPILGPFLQRLGLFQLLADGGKLLLKEDPIPGHVNKFYYVAAPIVALIPAFSTVTFVPFVHRPATCPSDSGRHQRGRPAFRRTPAAHRLLPPQGWRRLRR